MALHSSGLQSQSKKLYREGLSRLMEQEQQLLRQENERLKAELHNINAELVQSREKVAQTEQPQKYDWKSLHQRIFILQKKNVNVWFLAFRSVNMMLQSSP